MKLHLLIPSLKYACSLAIATHKEGKLGERAALVVAFDKNHSPQILFFPDTNDPKLPPDYIYGIQFVDAALCGICTTLNSLELDHETTVERMVFNIIAQLNVLLYALRPAHELTLELARKLDYHAVCGITSAIAREKFTDQKPLLVPALNERN